MSTVSWQRDDFAHVPFESPKICDSIQTKRSFLGSGRC